MEAAVLAVAIGWNVCMVTLGVITHTGDPLDELCGKPKDKKKG